MHGVKCIIITEERTVHLELDTLNWNSNDRETIQQILINLIFVRNVLRSRETSYDLDSKYSLTIRLVIKSQNGRLGRCFFLLMIVYKLQTFKHTNRLPFLRETPGDRKTVKISQ